MSIRIQKCYANVKKNMTKPSRVALAAGAGILSVVQVLIAPSVVKADPPEIEKVEIYPREKRIDYPWSGRISAIAINPVNTNQMVVAGESGGLFFSGNAFAASRSWGHISNFATHVVNDVVLIPRGVSGSPRVWVTTSDTYVRDSGVQLWRGREDGFGGPWIQQSVARGTAIDCGAPNTNAYRIAKARDGSNAMFVATACGVARTTDGESWNMASPIGSREPVYSVETMRDGTLLAGTASGVWLSSNRGDTWSLALGEVPVFRSPVDRFNLQTDSEGSAIFAVQLTRGTKTDVYVSTNLGRNWRKFNVPAPGGSSGSGGLTSVALDVQSGTLNVFVSDTFQMYLASCPGRTLSIQIDTCQTNSSLRWTQLNLPHADARQVVFAQRGTERKIFASSDGGLHSADPSRDIIPVSAWVTDRPSSGLNALQIYNTLGEGSNDIFFGTQDNSFGYSDNGGGRWAYDLNEGYLLDRGSNVTRIFSPAITLFAPGPGLLYGSRTSLAFNFSAFPRTSLRGCDGTTFENLRAWNSPVSGWGNPIWLTGSTYIQDAPPNVIGIGPHFWRITNNFGCTWSSMPGNAYPVRSGFVAQQVGSPVSQIFVGMIDNTGSVKLSALVNPTSPSAAEWRYPLMLVNPADRRTGSPVLAGGIAVTGAQFGFNPVFDVNPEDPNHILAVEKDTGRLMVSNTGGNIWEEVRDFSEKFQADGVRSLKNNLGTVAIWSISFSPWDPRIVLVGTVDHGLMISWDRGRTWSFAKDLIGSRTTDGLSRPTSFFWQSPTRVVMSSYGRGLWDLNLVTTFRRPAPGTPRPGEVCSGDPLGLPAWVIWLCAENDVVMLRPLVPRPPRGMPDVRDFIAIDPTSVRGLAQKGGEYALLVVNDAPLAQMLGQQSPISVIRESELNSGRLQGFQRLSLPQVPVSGIVTFNDGQVALLTRRPRPANVEYKPNTKPYQVTETKPTAVPNIRTEFQGAKNHNGISFYRPSDVVRVRYSGLPSNTAFRLQVGSDTRDTFSGVTSANGVIDFDLGKRYSQGLYEFTVRPIQGNFPEIIGRFFISHGRFFRTPQQ